MQNVAGCAERYPRTPVLHHGWMGCSLRRLAVTHRKLESTDWPSFSKFTSNLVVVHVQFAKVGTHRAGDAVTSTDLMAPGTCMYVTTGAALPCGTDAVVRIEHSENVENEQKKVRIVKNNDLKQGANIRSIGCDVRKGEIILSKGNVIEAQDFGILAHAGVTFINVYELPTVGIFSNGNELYDPFSGKDSDHSYSQSKRFVGDSNRYTLKMLLEQKGYEVIDFGILPDDFDISLQKIDEISKRCDIVVSSGGVSMGDHDFVKPALERLGTILFDKVRLKPGKPTTFGKVTHGKETTDGLVTATQKDTLFFALPGNPASCSVCFHLFVSLALNISKGLSTSDSSYPVVSVQSVSLLRQDSVRPEFHRSYVFYNHDSKNWSNGLQLEPGLVAASTGVQRSSRAMSMLRANALLFVPRGDSSISPGESVQAHLIAPIGSSLNLNDLLESNTSSQESAGCRCHTDQEPEENAKRNCNVCLLIVSDRASKGEMKDKVKETVKKNLSSHKNLQFSLVDSRCVPDDPEKITAALESWVKHGIEGNDVNFIITSGGTGFAARDVTPEATEKILDKKAPGLIHQIMKFGLEKTPFASLSRAVAGIKQKTLIVNMPGSPKAVTEYIEAIKDLLPHIFQLLEEREPTCHSK